MFSFSILQNVATIDNIRLKKASQIDNIRQNQPTDTVDNDIDNIRQQHLYDLESRCRQSETKRD